MRFFFVTLLFFFAPVILMFALRHLTLLLRIWLAWRRARDARGTGGNIIDITPEKPQAPSRRFIAIAVIVGIICASLVWMRLGEPVGEQGSYVPAHSDGQGHVVPGHYTRP